MYNTRFWRDAVERAVKSFAQALLLLWAADGAFNVLTVDVPAAFGVAAGATVLSLLTSVVSAPIADTGSASVVPATPPPPYVEH